MPYPTISPWILAPRFRACSHSSRISTAAPSPITKPSRSLSNGRLAVAGSSLRSDSACGGVGSMLAGYGLRGLLVGIITSLLAWLVWSWFTYAIGVTIFGGTARYAELLRTIGFAHGPLMLRL